MRFFQRFMEGRYGRDQLNIFLLVLFVIFWIIGVFTSVQILDYIGLIVAIIAIFRMFSRNYEKRRKENDKFLKVISPISRWFRMRRTMRQDKDHCYFKCPRCGQYLRVPRGKGKLTIKCKSCGASFQEKT